MIVLEAKQLAFHFPEVHPQAKLTIELQRTLRIPDDGRDYPLPPGLGRFPIEHVDDHARRLPASWVRRGGVIAPMYQSEALWLNFRTKHIRDQAAYPFAIQVATGKVNAVTGDAWGAGLNRRPQDYVVAPEQPWLDGYSVGEGVVRQFVAMPLGKGYTAEEQLTGAAEFGGIQVRAFPMKRDVFERRFPVQQSKFRAMSIDCLTVDMAVPAAGGMGIAPGGKIRQQVFDDPYQTSDWDTGHTSRCFIHLLNSQQWRGVTGQDPPHRPPTAKRYNAMGLPWYDFYEERAATTPGNAALASLDSVADHARTIGEQPPDDPPLTPEQIVDLRRGLSQGQVREGD